MDVHTIIYHLHTYIDSMKINAVYQLTTTTLLTLLSSSSSPLIPNHKQRTNPIPQPRRSPKIKFKSQISSAYLVLHRTPYTQWYIHTPIHRYFPTHPPTLHPHRRTGNGCCHTHLHPPPQLQFPATSRYPGRISFWKKITCGLDYHLPSLT
ncbi:hypothetical protein BO94DRAFT_323616 [Aspergillus sclerotioniger CBS 115572]|uniref:Uncharacterized protein n=1 Tax=Aspergillus sclerotioniger CBS 115572 TaxID=1450535 RepID=A0A317X9A4_9EURO|nr:hypothetical protein BO94DRAFT_323616 [Aspergillus sclerotioniger CBS 115572]PWY94187.1 hypothetical protein BO94DRAFT_323616 [Aspergillus sclerotioniger CBS 115572]